MRDAAAVVPGRPVKYVRDHVRRLYDPKGKKGPWTADEDAALLRLVSFYDLKLSAESTYQRIRFSSWRMDEDSRYHREDRTGCTRSVQESASAQIDEAYWPLGSGRDGSIDTVHQGGERCDWEGYDQRE